MRRPVVLVFLLSSFSSCVNLRHHFRENGLARASFDLNCPPDQLGYGLLNREEDSMMSTALGAQMGVTGCGKRAVFVLSGEPRNRFSWTWLANGAVTASD
ncbi:MAG: hypothetical protein ABTQ32_04695 [Myxococcaceae bacterium]